MTIVSLSSSVNDRRTYCPLHTEKTKQESHACWPTSRLVSDTGRAEDVVGGMHFRSRRGGQKHDDDNYAKG